MDEQLFVALDIGTEARESLTKVQHLLAASAKEDDVVSRLENPMDFHITLRYIGTKFTREEAIQRLRQIAFCPFQLETSGLGMFLAPDLPVIWSGAQGDISALRTLQSQVDAVLGCTDARGFTPHITLAYLTYPFGGFETQVQNPAAPILVKRFSLYRILEQGAPQKFEQIAAFPLNGTEQ